MFAQLRRRLFGIAPEETRITRRGFAVSDGMVKERLETIGVTFVDGYHAALEHPYPSALVAHLNTIDNELRGFAYEGAGMGLALLDMVLPWSRRRLLDFLHGPGKPHAYMIQIGVGWALARLRRPVEPGAHWARLDPVTRWLVFDGYGFHEGYFDWQRFIERQEPPARLTGYACRGFDQGLGRSLWFVKGADVDRIAGAVAAFPLARHNDLWSGVGLACAYAGGVKEWVLYALSEAAGPAYRPALAQGVVFAAKTRLRAHNPATHTELACQVLCDMSLADAAALFDVTGQGLPTIGATPAFEMWRQRIQAQFTRHKEVAR